MSGQTLNDRLTAARHTLAGQGLARVVCKATTEEVIGPKKKHLDYLLHCTNEPNVSIPQLANLLIERTQHASWVIVFKALITVHHLMCYGNERFTQYLASSNCTFQLGNFLDKCGVQGYDMSTFIRRYAKYLNEKAVSYRTVAFDFCKVKRGKEDGILRTMNTDKLLKTLPILQSQLDALLEFDCTANDLTNGVVNSCFMLLFRDLIRLFACYNDGIINLLEKYFDMNKKHCREALDIYKKFLIRMDRVAEFLKVAENVGIDKGDIPDLTKAPSSLLDALEQHLASLEGRKTSNSTTAARATNVRNAMSALSYTSTAFNNAGGDGTPTQEVNGVKVDDSVRKAVEEEAAVLNQLKFENESPLLWEQPAWDDPERRLKELTTGEVTSPPSGSSKTNPFLASPVVDESAPIPPPISSPSSSQGIIDLFSPPSGTTTTAPSSGPTSDDLLCLGGNPFADSLFGSQNQTQQQSTFGAFETNGFSSSISTNAGTFASDASFAAAFGSSTPQTAATQGLTVAAASSGTMPELMRGAGTTPILAQPPDTGFGDLTETTDEAPPTTSASEESTDFIWGSQTTTSAPSSAPLPSEPNPFGTTFEPPPPAAPAQTPATIPPISGPAPASTAASEGEVTSGDLFGLDSGDFADFGEQPLSAQPCAPPPSPFGGLEVGMAAPVGGSTPDLRSRSPAHTTTVTPPSSQQPPKSSGIDDLNFAIQKAMQMPSYRASLAAASSTPTLSSSLPGPGIMTPRPGLVGQPPPPVSVGITPPTSLASSSLTRLDSLGSSTGPAGTPTGRASSTPGYGTPPSGLSSPAKSVAGFGSSGTGFDVFGDVLQPQAPVKTPAGGDKGAVGGTFMKGDLDSTLASLASNLDINGPKQALKNRQSSHQWGSPKPPSKTGGNVWAGPAAGAAVPGNMSWAGSPQHGFQTMGTPGGQWNTTGIISPFPQQSAASGMVPQQTFSMGGTRPVAPTNVGMGMGVSMAGSQLVQPTMYGNVAPQRPVVAQTSAATPPSQPTSVNDPFGAL